MTEQTLHEEEKPLQHKQKHPYMKKKHLLSNQLHEQIGGPVFCCCFFYQRISQRALWTSFEPMGPNASWVQMLQEGAQNQNV